jgi:hypothetical protein
MVFASVRLPKVVLLPSTTGLCAMPQQCPNWITLFPLIDSTAAETVAVVEDIVPMVVLPMIILFIPTGGFSSFWHEQNTASMKNDDIKIGYSLFIGLF